MQLLICAFVCCSIVLLNSSLCCGEICSTKTDQLIKCHVKLGIIMNSFIWCWSYGGIWLKEIIFSPDKRTLFLWPPAARLTKQRPIIKKEQHSIGTARDPNVSNFKRHAPSLHTSRNYVNAEACGRACECTATNTRTMQSSLLGFIIEPFVQKLHFRENA